MERKDISQESEKEDLMVRIVELCLSGEAMTPQQIKDDYNWAEAFKYTDNIRVAVGCKPDPFTIDDVLVVFAYDSGINDERSWVCAGITKDGRYFYLSAGCDYTGWGCQESGDTQVAGSLTDLIRYGMDEEGRIRLNLELQPE